MRWLRDLDACLAAGLDSGALMAEVLAHPSAAAGIELGRSLQIEWLFSVCMGLLGGLPYVTKCGWRRVCCTVYRGR